MKNNLDVGVALGAGVGTAFGVALHNVAVGVALEAALGAAFGAAMKTNKGN